MKKRLSRVKAIIGAISGLGLMLGTAMPSFAYAGAQGDDQNDVQTELADVPDAVGTDAVLDVDLPVEPVDEEVATEKTWELRLESWASIDNPPELPSKITLPVDITYPLADDVEPYLGLPSGWVVKNCYSERGVIFLSLEQQPPSTIEYTINYYDYRTNELIKSRTVEDAPLADDRYDTIEAWARKHGVMDYSDAPYGHDLKAMDDSKLYSNHVYSVYYERCGYKNVPATVDYWTADEAGTGRVKIADRVEFTIPQPVLDDNRADDEEQYADYVLPYIKDIPGYRFTSSCCYPGVYVVRSSGRQFEAGLGDTSYDVYYVQDTQKITFHYIDEDDGTEIVPKETRDDITDADGFHDGVLIGELPDKFVKSFDGYEFSRYESDGDQGKGSVDIYYKKLMTCWDVVGVAANPEDNEDFAPYSYHYQTPAQWLLDESVPETSPDPIAGWLPTGKFENNDTRTITYFYDKALAPWTVRGVAADEEQADEFAPNAYAFETEPSWVLDNQAPETTPRNIDGWWLAGTSVDPDSREIVYSYKKKTPEPPAPPKEEEDITPPADEEKTPEPAPKQEQAKEVEPVPAPEPRQEEKEAPEPTMMPQTGDTAPITAALLAAGLAAVAGGVATRRLTR